MTGRREDDVGWPRPGFSLPRVAAQMRAAVARCELDLGGLAVLTEAATGAYACTAALAALGGARRVYALAQGTAYGSADRVAAETLAVARAVGVERRVEIVRGRPAATAAAREADIVTNSGSLRPLDADLIGRLPLGAVVALMYEAWEFRAADVDLAACRGRGVPVAAVNERHPRVGVFPYLGPLAVQQLHEAGIPVHGCRLAVLCDNGFAPFLRATLELLAEAVEVAATVDALPSRGGPFDAVLVALRPRDRPVLDAGAAERLAARLGRTPVVQYWGDVDRGALRALGVPVWPPLEPRPGHMGILMSAAGPDPVVRLQAGGLRAAEIVHRRRGAFADLAGTEAELLEPWRTADGRPS